MWLKTNSVGYALHHLRNENIIGETKRYANGAVEVYLIDDRPLLKFERHGNLRCYWYWEETQYEYLYNN